MTKFLTGLIFLLSFTAQAETRSFFTLPTGNGHGFSLYDSAQGRLIGFLDHPYRFLRPSADPRANGIERRNLLEELSLSFAGSHSDSGEASYLEETNVIRVQSSDEERIFFSPFGLEKNALIALARTTTPGAIGRARLRFHLGANPVSPNFWTPTLDIVKIPGEHIERKAGYWVETGHGLGAMIYVPLQTGTRGDCELTGGSGSFAPSDPLGDPVCDGDDLGLRLSAQARSGWFGVLVAYVEDASQVDREAGQILSWVHRRSSVQLLAYTLGEWKAWRKPPPPQIRADEQALWRQSEAVLRMAQMREPNTETRVNHGMILASLAPGGWATGWVRDGTYATTALARSGHFAEAKASLDFFLNARPVGKFKSYVDGDDYRISVTRYFGSGEEEADYSDQATPNVETDGWGLYLWAARQYLDASHDLTWLRSSTRQGSVYEAMRQGIASVIAEQLEPKTSIMKPDSSIWEVHQQNARHFAYTTLTAARGLCDFAHIARLAGQTQDQARYAALAARVRAAFLKAFAVPEGYLVAAVERSQETDLDAAVADSFGFDLFDNFRSPLAVKTLAHLETMRLPNGGFMRVGGDSTYQTDEWAFIDLRMAGAYRRMGLPQTAEALIDRIEARASLNFDLLPEMYNATPNQGPIGLYRGSNPMVGYGAGAWILATLERGGLEPRSCD